MNIILIGNGGHSKVVREMVDVEHHVIAILDDKFEYETEIDGIYYAPISRILDYLDATTGVVIAIGDNPTRKKLAKILPIPIDQYVTIIHPTAVVSQSAVIKKGTVVMPNTVINASAKIGIHSIINTGAIIEHDNNIGDYAHISPNATLTGNVKIGEGVHVGATATIIPGMEIGNWSIIGAGSTVIRNIPEGCKAVGCPARILTTLQEKNVIRRGGVSIESS